MHKSMKAVAGLLLAGTILVSGFQGVQAGETADDHNGVERKEKFYPYSAYLLTGNHITNVLDAGLMTGYPDGDFHPEGYLTRAELATILVKTFNLDSRRETTSNAFDTVRDVKDNNWAHDAIETVVNTGIMNPRRPGRFSPNRHLTRAEAYAIIGQAYGVMNFDDNTLGEIYDDYRDSYNVPKWAKKPMATALHEGFVNTDERANKIDPWRTMRRGDMAYTLSRYLLRQKGAQPHFN